MSKSISEVFDVEPIGSKYEITKSESPVLGEADNDAALASDNIKQLIDIGMDSLREAAAVASTAESPRAFEVVATMIKSLSDMNLQLMDIHAKKKALHTESNPNQAQVGGSVTNNAIFVGTTKDINELIMQRLNK